MDGEDEKTKTKDNETMVPRMVERVVVLTENGSVTNSAYGNGIEFCVMDKGCSLPRTNGNQTMVPMMVEREKVLPVKKKNDRVANNEEGMSKWMSFWTRRRSLMEAGGGCGGEKRTRESLVEQVEAITKRSRIDKTLDKPRRGGQIPN